jgi:hypothetical protein
MSVSLISIPELDRKGLRNFGFTTGAIIAALFGGMFPWLLDRSIPIWPWVLGVALLLWAVVAPGTLRFVYRGWMRFGYLMSRITTPLILGAFFFVAVTPMALIRRMLGKDSMPRGFDRATDSYRVMSHKPSRSSLERPF